MIDVRFDTDQGLRLATGIGRCGVYQPRYWDLFDHPATRDCECELIDLRQVGLPLHSVEHFVALDARRDLLVPTRMRVLVTGDDPVARAYAMLARGYGHRLYKTPLVVVRSLSEAYERLGLERPPLSKR